MLLKYYQKIKVFAGTHQKSLFIFGILLFLLLPIYDKYLWIENDPFPFGHIVALEKYDNIAHIPEYKPYLLYFLHLLSMPFYLVACVAMQEEEYHLSILPEMSIYMLVWLLVLAYHCFMLILPFTLKNFVQAAKEKQKRFLYWLYGISLPGILLSMAYILFCFSGGDWGDCNCGGTFVWLRQLPLSGYIPIIYFVTITALYQYKYSKGKKLKNLFLTFAALLLPIAGLVFGIFAFYGYHAQPKLVKEVIWSPGLLEIAPDGAIYGNETAQKFFEKQLLSPPQNIFYGKNQWNPLILRGKRIKKLSGNFFDTNDVKLEFSPGNPDTLYCYYVSERFNNFLSGAF